MHKRKIGTFQNRFLIADFAQCISANTAPIAAGVKEIKAARLHDASLIICLWISTTEEKRHYSVRLSTFWILETCVNCFPGLNGAPVQQSRKRAYLRQSKSLPLREPRPGFSVLMKCEAEAMSDLKFTFHGRLVCRTL